MSRAQNINLAPMLERIGAQNVPEKTWEIEDVLRPSVVAADVSRLVPTPKAPGGLFGFAHVIAPPMFTIIGLVPERRDMVIRSIRWRIASLFGQYTIYAAICTRIIADTHIILDPARRVYPLYVGGAPPTTGCFETWSNVAPDTWGPPAVCNYTILDWGVTQEGSLCGLEWLVPDGYVFMLFATPTANYIIGVVDWTEQPPGAHTGSMVAFP